MINSIEEKQNILYKIIGVFLKLSIIAELIKTEIKEKNTTSGATNFDGLVSNFKVNIKGRINTIDIEKPCKNRDTLIRDFSPVKYKINPIDIIPKKYLINVKGITLYFLNNIKNSNPLKAPPR